MCRIRLTSVMLRQPRFEYEGKWERKQDNIEEYLKTRVDDLQVICAKSNLHVLGVHILEHEILAKKYNH